MKSDTALKHPRQPVNRIKILVLFGLLCLPFIALSVIEHRYTALEDRICRSDQVFNDACANNTERFEKRLLINTNLYRYVGDQVGRSFGTSPPFNYNIETSAEIEFDRLEENKQLTAKRSSALYDNISNAQADLKSFNLTLLVALIINVAVVSVVLTLLVQDISKYLVRRNQTNI